MPEVSTTLEHAGQKITLPQATRVTAVLAPVMVSFQTASGLSYTARISTLLNYSGLKVAALPDILLSANLPDGIRGYPYSGTISAMNIGGATGDISITVDQLPAGLSLGPTTTTDHQTFSATISGTLQ